MKASRVIVCVCGDGRVRAIKQVPGRSKCSQKPLSETAANSWDSFRTVRFTVLCHVSCRVGLDKLETESRSPKACGATSLVLS